MVLAVRADDAYVQGTQTLATVSISGTSGAEFEALSATGTVSNTVVDDADATTVTLSSSTNGAAVVEGGSITYSASVGAPVTGSDLVISLTNGQSITIPVGQSSGSRGAGGARRRRLRARHADAGHGVHLRHLGGRV